MRIEDEKVRQMTFGDLEAGDCFEYGYDFYMKTTSVKGKGGVEIWNTVFLKSGAMTWFDDMAKVIYRNAKIVVD